MRARVGVPVVMAALLVAAPSALAAPVTKRCKDDSRARCGWRPRPDGRGYPAGRNPEQSTRIHPMRPSRGSR